MMPKTKPKEKKKSYAKEQKMADAFLIVPEAVEMGIPQSTMYYFINTERLKVFMRGSVKLVLKKEVDKLIKEGYAD